MRTSWDWICRVLGHLSNVLDWFRPLVVRWRGGEPSRGQLDKTGLVQGAKPVVLGRYPDAVCLVRYPSLAHTLWRAQELTLFDRHRHLLGEPLADFGCGDGSFGSVLFPGIAFGIDNDPEALAACGNHPAYRQQVLATLNHIPLPTASVGSLVANSVMEHTLAPEALLGEIARVIRPGGVFMMTVPLMGFARHLSHYFGSYQSRRINQAYHHHNLWEESQWLDGLERQGLEPFVSTQYQGPVFTFVYHMLRLAGERGLGASSGFQEWFWKKIELKAVAMVRASVHGVHDGANLFVVARRGGFPASGQGNR